MSRPEPPYTATTGGLIRHAARAFGDRPFVVLDAGSRSVRMTYAEMEHASRLLARRFLAAGMAKGMRVAAQFPYGFEWIIAWLAVTRIGGVFMPLSTAYKPAELAKVLRHADAHTLLMPAQLFGEDRAAFLKETVAGLADNTRQPLRLPAVPCLRTVWFSDAKGALPAWATPLSFDTVDGGGGTHGGELVSEELFEAVEAEVSPADLMMAIHTSGTTSEPKGVLHTHGALVRHGANLAHALGWTQDERVFCGMPFFWIGGIAYTVLPVMHLGAQALCMERFEAGQALDFMQREQATMITGWPGVTGPLINHPSRASRNFPALTSPRYALGMPRLHNSLGMTETCGPHTGAAPDTWQNPVPGGLKGSMGPAIAHVQHRIADPDTGAALPEGEEGAILVRGYSLMAGMIKREREDVFTPDGWYNTGDKGFFKEGILFLTGRLSEMIKTSGNNVAPAEVEGVLLTLPGVKEAYVAGLPDAERGEIVAAALVPAAGAKLDPEQVRSALRERLSNYKVPRRILLLTSDKVPWLATGKPDRINIKKLLAVAP